jgi:ubiquinone/menaquinone biosynthesis C-methylase UbiE
MNEMKSRDTIIKLVAAPDNLFKNAVVKLTQNLIKTDRFRLTEAVAYSWRIDVWQRYSIVVENIKMMGDECKSILDVGGSGGSILSFIHQSSYNFCILDIDKTAIMGTDKRAKKIIGDGCRLPFKDGSIDVVVSVDSLEHVPKQRRNDYLCELKRVAKKKVLLHLPVNSDDGTYKGEEYDEIFNKKYKKITGVEDSNIHEHLKYGLPSIKSIKQVFPESTIIGRQNCDIWYIYFILERLPYIRLCTGLLYLLFLKDKDNKPPYHACLMIWEKNHGK